MSFGKLYEQTFTGSMMGSGPTVFAVWGYVVAHVRPPGKVELNPRLLCAILGAPLEDVRKALDVLTSPDPESRTKEHEGRRLIREGEFAYTVPTFSRYRNGTEEERKAANAGRQAKHREKKKANGNGKWEAALPQRPVNVTGPHPEQENA